MQDIVTEVDFRDLPHSPEELTDYEETTAPGARLGAVSPFLSRLCLREQWGWAAIVVPLKEEKVHVEEKPHR
ncbi:hypothetical protein [Arthrobacter sp. NPDC057009]|uniref:hypothetical protein n=1 Tax=Arthrobacter sp. NPDC057009 TaxID=3345996 RepID=UPI00363520A3